MWKIWHRLFGTHYIALSWCDDDYVKRVKFTLAGRPYVKVYDYFVWLDDPKNNWVSLTFDKSIWLRDRGIEMRPRAIA